MNFLKENHPFLHVIIAKTTYPIMKKVKKTECLNLFCFHLFIDKIKNNMKLIYQKVWAQSFIIGLVGLLHSCVEYPTNTWVEEVKNMTLEITEEWNLEYDYKGRLIRYGNVPIQYAKNRIDIGTMDSDGKKEKMYSAVFLFSEEKGWYSECRIRMDSIVSDVVKRTEYFVKGDTLVMNSVYQNIKDSSFVRNSLNQYVYDTKGRLIDVIYHIVNMKGEKTACHSFFDYKCNIGCESNLNLQAYWIDCIDWDTFFFFLLNLCPHEGNKALPNGIRHCVNHGKAMYEADGLYRLDGERLVRMEIVSNDVKLKARYEFAYFAE